MRQSTIAVCLLLFALQATAATHGRRSIEQYWWLCPVDRTIPIRPEFSSAKIDADNTEIRADSARIVNHGTTYFAGDVELIQSRASVKADEVTYDRDADTAAIEGHGHIWDRSLLWQGERGLFNFADDLSRLERGKYWLLNRQGRGAARLIKSDNRSHITRLQDVDYSTCSAQGQVWKLSASRIRLNHNTESGYAVNAILRIKGVPVLYLPYFTFPLSSKRKSGFLIPTFSTSSTRGLDLRLPYYINIAPNQDATVIPRHLSNHGEMLGGDYRYLGATFKSELSFEFLASDSVRNNKARSAVTIKHQQTYANGQGFVNGLFQNVSDAHYFEDFGSSLGISSQRYLDRRLETTLIHGPLYVYGLVQSYQNVDSSIPAAFGPYQRLPQIIFQTLYPEAHLKPHFYTLGELTYFNRDGSVSGGRIHLEPTMSLPFLKPWAFIRPTLGVRYTEYLLTNSDKFSASESRAVPVLSVDTQLFFERRFRIFGNRLLQTLEPRIYYLLVPKVGQDQYPVFDSGLFDFSFASLFLGDRFSGHDRVGDANQIALGVTSRYFSMRSGRELFDASIGQIYYFRPRQITLPGVTVVDDSTSELIGEVATHLSEAWLARATMQWNPNTDRTEKSAFSIRYAPKDGTVINAAYRRRVAITDVEQTDLSFRLPMTESVSLIGRWAYSLRKQETLEMVGGIELEDCCWGIRLLGRRYIRNVQGQFDTAVLVEAQLKGLGGLGRGTANFLRRSIPGYESLF